MSPIFSNTFGKMNVERYEIFIEKLKTDGLVLLLLLFFFFKTENDCSTALTKKEAESS